MESNMSIHRIGSRRARKKIFKDSPPVVKVQCQLCFNNVQQYRMARICTCDHTFCEDCLMTYMMFKLKNFQLINCPSEGCLSLADEKCSLFSLALTDKEKSKYKKIKFRKDIEEKTNLRLCPDENCQEGFIQLQNQKQKNGQCNKCNQSFCLKCLRPTHKGTRCTDNEEARRLTKKYNYRRCLTCRRVVERIDGCNHMTCMCGHQFCYICGSDWKYDHECSLFKPQETVCEKLRLFLDQFSCCPFMENEGELNVCEKFWKIIVALVYTIVYCFIMLWWILVCIVFGIFILIGSIPVYLARGSYVFFREWCKYEIKRAILPVIIWVVFLPLSLPFFALLVFCWDTSERRNSFIFRFCWTATCTEEEYDE